MQTLRSLGKPFVPPFIRDPGAPGPDPPARPPVLSSSCPRTYPLSPPPKGGGSHPAQGDIAEPRLARATPLQASTCTGPATAEIPRPGPNTKEPPGGVEVGSCVVHFPLRPPVCVPACLLGQLSIRGQTPRWQLLKIRFVSLCQLKPSRCLGRRGCSRRV